MLRREVREMIGGDNERKIKGAPLSMNLSVSLPADVLEAARNVAIDEHRSLSNLIAHVLSTYIEQKEKVAS